MTQRFLRLSAAVFLVSLLLVPPLSAQSGEPAYCDSVVVDRLDVLEDSIVERAAQDLVDFGTEIHVITLDGGGDLRGDVEELAQACSTWVDLDGGASSRLLVLSVDTVNRRTEILIGSEYNEELPTAVWDSIVSNDMNPRFADGDPTQAMVDGLAAFEERVTDPISAAEFAAAQEEQARINAIAAAEAAERRAELEVIDAANRAERNARFRQIGSFIAVFAAGLVAVYTAFIAVISRLRKRKENRTKIEAMNDLLSTARDRVFDLSEAVPAAVTVVGLYGPTASSEAREEAEQKAVLVDEKYGKFVADTQEIGDDVEALTIKASDELLGQQAAASENLIVQAEEVEDLVQWIDDFAETEKANQKESWAILNALELSVPKLVKRIKELRRNDYNTEVLAASAAEIADDLAGVEAGGDFLPSVSQSAITKLEERHDMLDAEVDTLIAHRTAVQAWMSSFRVSSGDRRMLADREADHIKLGTKFGASADQPGTILKAAARHLPHDGAVAQVRVMADDLEWGDAKARADMFDHDYELFHERVADYQTAVAELEDIASRLPNRVEELIADIEDSIVAVKRRELFLDIILNLEQHLSLANQTHAATQTSFPLWQELDADFDRLSASHTSDMAEWGQRVKAHLAAVVQAREDIQRLQRRASNVGLSLSLHSIPDDVRENELTTALAQLANERNRVVSAERAEEARRERERERQRQLERDRKRELQRQADAAAARRRRSSSSSGGGGRSFGGGGSSFGGGGKSW